MEHAEMREGGRCYEIAGQMITGHPVPPADFDWRLAHGSVGGAVLPLSNQFVPKHGHAWLESVCGLVFDDSQSGGMLMPKEIYYLLGNVDPESVVLYDRVEASRLMLETGDYGPWQQETQEVAP